jgi:hypothetical protein
MMQFWQFLPNKHIRSNAACAHSHLNGSVHTIIPGELLLCDQLCDEADLEQGGQTWRDHGNGRRGFGAEFYADLLGHMGVHLVVLVVPALSETHTASPSTNAVMSIGRATGGAAGAFARRGIRVLRAYRGDSDGPELGAGEGAIDAAQRIAAAGAGGATALLCAAPDLGRAATLAAAWVAAQHSLFPSPEAASGWVGLAAGPAAAAGIDAAGLRAEWARRWDPRADSEGGPAAPPPASSPPPPAKAVGPGRTRSLPAGSAGPRSSSRAAAAASADRKARPVWRSGGGGGGGGRETSSRSSPAPLADPSAVAHRPAAARSPGGAGPAGARGAGRGLEGAPLGAGLRGLRVAVAATASAAAGLLLWHGPSLLAGFE